MPSAYQEIDFTKGVGRERGEGMKLETHGLWIGDIVIRNIEKPLSFTSNGTDNLTTTFNGKPHILLNVRHVSKDEGFSLEIRD